MRDELLNKLVLIVEVCSPIFTGLTILYFRLSSRIDKAEVKSDVRIDSLRKEIKEEIQALDYKMEQKFMHMEQKLEQKFERIDQKFDRLFEVLIIRNQLGRGHPIKKTK